MAHQADLERYLSNWIRNQNSGLRVGCLVCYCVDQSHDLCARCAITVQQSLCMLRNCKNGCERATFSVGPVASRAVAVAVAQKCKKGHNPKF